MSGSLVLGYAACMGVFTCYPHESKNYHPGERIMEQTRTTLASEIAAELEVSLKSASQRLARKLQQSQRLQQALQASGVIHAFPLPQNETAVLDIAGVASSSATLSAFGGLLYGFNIHAHQLKLQQQHVLDAREQVRVHMGDLDFYESSLRLRWKLIQHMYELLNEIISARTPPQVILLSLPILVSRDEAGNREQTEEVQEEWTDMVSAINSFWSSQLHRLFPFNPEGCMVASIQTSAAWSLFVALKNNPNTSPDETTADLAELIQREWLGLRQVGMSRLLYQLLSPHSRTVAYALEDLKLDPRWQPAELHHSGILGFSMRARARTPVWQVQVVGHRTQWSAAMLDRLATAITQATLVEGENAQPLPLWYAERLARFSSAILHVFRDLAEEQMASPPRASEKVT
jgi:hypothetical protein